MKRHWEEPFSRAVIAQAIKRLRLSRSLRVLDIGCGTGTGFTLVNESLTHGARTASVPSVQYVGLDVSAEMINTARKLHNQAGVEFVEGDIRTSIPDAPYDLYLSCGVPYSHLTATELQDALRRIFSLIRRNCARSVVVIDVLGRYSIEWVQNWASTRWMYKMSFFNTDTNQEATPMSFYSAKDLRSTMAAAALQAGCALADLAFFDRSITVGRHTTTGEFNTAVPPFRELVNTLLDPSETTDLSKLEFNVQLEDAPQEILAFFGEFGSGWNEHIKQASQFIHGYDQNSSAFPRIASQTWSCLMEPALATQLQRFEATFQRGLGVGHSLIAVALVHGKV